MIEVYIKEYVMLVDYILNKNLGFRLENNNLAVKRPVLTKLMDSNLYNTSGKKLIIWKKLLWIDSESDRCTKMIRDSRGKPVRMVVINMTVYTALKELL